MDSNYIINELDKIIKASKAVIDSAERLRGSLEQFSAPAPNGGKIDIREIIKKRNNRIIKIQPNDRRVVNG
jgi:hypothetical protein